ncbi:MAG: hypothetical protein QOK88_11205 [Nitrososphaeraceae archaeon]|nr:hypothetical protein [Nitrososphaeraceae archaeon]
MHRSEHEYWLYGHSHSSNDDLFAHIKNIADIRRVSIALVSSKKNIINTIKEHHPEGFIVQIYFNEPVFTIQVSRFNAARNSEEIIKAVCARVKNSSLYLLVSDYKPALFRSLILRLFDFNYPAISRVFIKSSEIQKLFIDLDSKEKLETIVRRALFYSRSSEDEKPDKDLKWTQKRFQEVYEIINDQNGWIRKIDFKAYSVSEKENIINRELKLLGSVSSNSHFIIKGKFDIFNKYFLQPTLETILNRLGYLQYRSDRAKEQLPEPLVIKLNRMVFSDDQWNQKFIEIMSEMKNVSISEYHTNPFIHLSLLDYQDGSSYGIWIVSDDEINIIPQIRASVASMNRLLNHIFERITEGEISQFVPITIEVAD